VEALLRWNNPDAGMVMPARFIRLAEERELINPIGAWVMQKACADLARLNRISPQPVYVSVNVSSLQIRDPDFVANVRRTLNETRLASELLHLELTESLILDSNRHIKQALTDLRADGVQFVLDDFGTGYSSLSYLRRFPIGRLKIDRSFVSDVPHDENAASVVTTIVALAQAMDMDITAEGVETAAQSRFLEQLGCVEQQGFHFAHAMPIVEIEQILGTSLMSVDATRRQAIER
jgi:EAL domain-containing protein (putative c-di-GMP-specific phosphodiesterase class I)